MAGLLVLGGYQYWKVHVGNQANQKLISQSQNEAQKLNAQAGKKRTRVNTDDKYFNRVLKQYCPDC